jgi:protein ImuB
VRLGAAPARRQERQEGLFDAGLRDPASFWENLARVAAIVGDDRVGTPAPVDTHRPDAFTMERPAEAVSPPAQAPVHPPSGPVLRRFRPPWPVRVVCDAGRPVRLEGGRLEGRVCAALGPWLGAGDWWKPGDWAAETWQVEMAAGGVYQVSCTRDGWGVEGMLD